MGAGAWKVGSALPTSSDAGNVVDWQEHHGYGHQEHFSDHGPYPVCRRVRWRGRRVHCQIILHNFTEQAALNAVVRAQCTQSLYGTL
jgi:hypothetical protein